MNMQKSGSGFSKFLYDLISDGKGASIHRLQNLLFTIIVAVYFYYQAIANFKLAEINEQEESLILCGAGYGIPREARPRQEKILVISRQLVNALQQHGNQNYHDQSRRMPQ